MRLALFMRAPLAVLVVASQLAPSVDLPLLSIANAQQPAARTEEATQRYKQGVKLFEEQDYNAALLEFRKAYELAPNYRVAYNIGQVYYQIQNYAKALQWFERYLNEGGKDITPERRGQVITEIEELKRRVGKLEIVSDQPEVEVSIDDESVGRTPFAAPLVVSAGRRKLTATKAGRAPVTQIVEVAGQESKRVTLTLPELTTAPTAVATTSGNTPIAPPPPSRFTTGSWVGLGLAGALGVGAVVTGVLTLGAASDAQKATYAGTDRARVDDLNDKRKTLALTTDILGGAALLTAGITLALTLSRSDSRPSTATSVSVGVDPRGAWLRGQF